MFENWETSFSVRSKTSWTPLVGFGSYYCLKIDPLPIRLVTPSDIELLYIRSKHKEDSGSKVVGVQSSVLFLKLGLFTGVSGPE